jgi:hypothetical protein
MTDYLTIEQYHALPGISASKLRLLTESNRHLDNAQCFAMDTPSLSMGNLVDCLLLEPELFKDRYAVAQKFDLRTNAGKAALADFQQKNESLTVITEDDYAQAWRMADNVNAIYGDIVRDSIKQQSLFADYKGIPIKCRLDMQWGDCDVDLKTVTLGSKDFSDRTLFYHIKQYGYDLGCGFRNIVRACLGQTIGDSYLLFVNTGPGNMVRLVRLDTDWISESEDRCIELLESRVKYLKTGVDKAPSVIKNYTIG